MKHALERACEDNSKDNQVLGTLIKYMDPYSGMTRVVKSRRWEPAGASGHDLALTCPSKALFLIHH